MLRMDGQVLELRVFRFAALYCSAVTDKITAKGCLLKDD